MIELIFKGLVSFGLSLAMLGLVFLGFPKLGLMDKPELYGHKRPAVPYSVGIMLFLVFVVSSILFYSLDANFLLLIGAGGLLVVVSFLDDYFKINPWVRLVVQIICSIGAVYSGARVLEISNPFGDPIVLGSFSVLLSVFWIVLLTNLLNFLDGVSGLSSGVSSIGFFVLFGLSVWPGMHLVDQSLVSFVSVTLGFIALSAAIFEFYSPKILVGDSGSMFFGFMLAVLSLINGGKLATVALVLIVPIFDGLWAFSRRLYNKKSPLQGDLEHFHHRLIDIGLSPKVILLIYYFVSLSFGLIALFSWNTFFKVVSLVLLMFGLVIVTYMLFYGSKRRNKSEAADL